MDGNDLKMSKKYFDNEWLWIYDLLGEKKPYRCLKPWDKKESGLLSDGSFVPCCMCYNTTMPIGDVNNESLVDILNGERYLEFRKKFSMERMPVLSATGALSTARKIS